MPSVTTQQTAVENQSGPTAAAPRRRISRRTSWTAALGLVLALGAGAGLGIALIPHAQPIRSSDVEACSLLSEAQAAAVLRTSLLTAPTPTTTDASVDDYSQSTFHITRYTRQEKVKNYDTCQYQPSTPSLATLTTTVLPSAPGTAALLDQTFQAAARHEKRDAQQLSLIPGLGDRAAISQGVLGASGIAGRVVYVQVGAWDVELDVTDLDERTTVALARELVSAPRLASPPAQTH